MSGSAWSNSSDAGKGGREEVFEGKAEVKINISGGRRKKKWLKDCNV